jgi:hypothetical protein
MSPLAFDKQGKPFSWHPRTAKLRVRLFRNPAARGTCCQVLDASGSPLFVEADVEYAEFRRITGNVPGLYRLDQCDDDGVELENAPAAYLTIEPIRNGGGLTTETTSPHDVNALAIIERLVAVQERIFASQADVMKQMASQHGVLMNAGSVAMQASAEIMRAPYRAPLALPEPRNAGNDDVDEGDERDEGEDSAADSEPEANSPFNIAMSFITPEMAHQLGAGAVEKIIEAFRKIFGAKQPTTASSAPAYVAPTVAQHVSVAQPGVATGASSRTAAPAPVVVETYEPRFTDADGLASSEIGTDGYDDGGELEDAAPLAAGPIATPAPMPAAPNPLIANAAPTTSAAPTPEQFAHLMAIYQRLSPAERAIAQRAVAQMNVATRSQWIAALSAKSVDDAIADLRGVLAQMQSAKRA